MITGNLLLAGATPGPSARLAALAKAEEPAEALEDMELGYPPDEDMPAPFTVIIHFYLVSLSQL